MAGTLSRQQCPRYCFLVHKWLSIGALPASGEFATGELRSVSLVLSARESTLAVRLLSLSELRLYGLPRKTGPAWAALVDGARLARCGRPETGAGTRRRMVAPLLLALSGTGVP